MNATLVAREDLTNSISIFTVWPDDGRRPFVPGQYFSLGLEIGDRLVQRPYSAASLPGSIELEFLIRHVDGGALTPALWSLAPGSRLFLGPPKGLFTLRPGDMRDHVFIAKQAWRRSLQWSIWSVPGLRARLWSFMASHEPRSWRSGADS